MSEKTVQLPLNRGKDLETQRSDILMENQVKECPEYTADLVQMFRNPILDSIASVQVAANESPLIYYMRYHLLDKETGRTTSTKNANVSEIYSDIGDVEPKSELILAIENKEIPLDRKFTVTECPDGDKEAFTRMILDEILKSATLEASYNFSSANSYEAAVEGLDIKLFEVSNVIHRNTLRGGATFIYCSPKVASILKDKINVTSDLESGVYFKGTMRNKMVKVIVDNAMPCDKILVGYKGLSYLDAGLFIAPYHITKDKNLVYAMEMIDPAHYAIVNLHNLDALNKFSKKLNPNEAVAKYILDNLSDDLKDRYSSHIIKHALSESYFDRLSEWVHVRAPNHDGEVEDSFPMKTRVSQEAYEDIAATYNQDAADALRDVTADEYQLEITRFLLHSLMISSGAEHKIDWDKFSGDSFAARSESLYDEILDSFHMMDIDTGGVGGKFIVTSPEIGATFKNIIDNKTVPSEFQSSLGVRYEGTTFDGIKIFVDPLFKTERILLGRRGRHVDDTGCTLVIEGIKDNRFYHKRVMRSAKYYTVMRIDNFII